MARQVEATGDEIRVIFGVDEAARFLRGWDPVPDHGGGDPLNRAIQSSYDALNDAFPDAGGAVEIFTERADWAGDGGHGWHAVNYRFPHEAVERVGHDADAVADWIADRTPDLLFAIEDERGRPIRFRAPRRRVAPGTGAARTSTRRRG